MAKSRSEKIPAGAHWITIHGGTHNETGEHTGRHVLLDKKGNIIGGSVPKAWQGHSIAHIKDAKTTGTEYHGMSKEDLESGHAAMKEAHESMKKELAQDVHGMAKFIRDTKDPRGNDIVSRVRKVAGGIKIGPESDIYTEYKESIPAATRKAVSHKDGRPIDEVADELGMSASDLIQALSNADTHEYKRIGDYYNDAKKEMGEDYEERLKAIEEIGNHVKAMEAALNRHKHGTATKEQELKLWGQLADKVDKLAPGSKDAFDKGGYPGLLDHLHDTAPRVYDALKKDAAGKMDSVKDLKPEQQAMTKAMHQHKGKKPRGENKAEPKPEAKPEEKEKEPWQMTAQEWHEHQRAQNGGKYHPDTSRHQWMSSVKQKVHADGIDSIKHLTDNDPGLKAYVENGFKTPRPPREKLAGEGMPFKKEQTERNNQFLDRANGAFFLMTQGHHVKEMRKILHKQGYDAALDYIKKNGQHADEKHMQTLRELAEADKAKGNGLAPKAKEDRDEVAAAPPADNSNVKKSANKRVQDLHDDIQAHLAGKMDENEFFRKHGDFLSTVGKRVGQRRGAEAEDTGQNGLETAVKTLRALKSGSQKPKEGANLGEHLLRRMKQGANESVRKGNENRLSREGTKLSAVINQARDAHMSEKGAEPSEDELFNRVKDNDTFKNTRYSASGTKKALEDREKFDAVRQAMKGQRSDTTLDKNVEGKEGDTGRVGDNIAADDGKSAEDHVVDLENERELKGKREQLHGILKQWGLSEPEARAVAHRFGVGHQEQYGTMLDWDNVAKHMSKDLGKSVKPETARKHFNNGRQKLHAHIGDDRMSMLMQKSLMDDPGVAELIYHLHALGIYDLIKSAGSDPDELKSEWVGTRTMDSNADLIKSLAPGEYVDACIYWGDGSVTAHIYEYQL